MSQGFILPIDKPAGPTSHDVVAMARRALGIRRIGHTGTLDPFASGLLLLCIEAATRLAEYLTDLPKTYRAVARLDGSTATDDVTGDFITHSDGWRSLDEDSVQAAFQRQSGPFMQTPSAFSAKRVAGERAYELARRGEVVQLEPVAVTVFGIRVMVIDLPMVEFEVDCSSGTYIRAIARDVGKDLGTGGYLSALRRTAVGRFRVDQSLTLDGLAHRQRIAAHRIAMLDAVGHLPSINITEEEEIALRYGRGIGRALPPGLMAVARDQELVALAVSDGQHIRPKKVFPRD